MRQTSSGWTVQCDGEEFDRPRLADAMREAVGHMRGATMQLGLSSRDALESWVTEHAARIEQEAG